MIKREKCECLIVRVSLTHDWCLCSNTSSLFSDLKFIMPRVRKNVNIMFSNPIWISSSRPNLNFLRLLWRAVPPKCSPAAACCAAPATSTTTPPCVIRYTKEEVSFYLYHFPEFIAEISGHEFRLAEWVCDTWVLAPYSKTSTGQPHHQTGLSWISSIWSSSEFEHASAWFRVSRRHHHRRHH